jgi:hypothetical protein
MMNMSNDDKDTTLLERVGRCLRPDSPIRGTQSLH